MPAAGDWFQMMMTPPTMIDVVAPAIVATVALSVGAVAELPLHQILGVLSFAGGWLAGTGARILVAQRARSSGGPWSDG